MKVFTSNDFEGYWPVGVGAVVVAESYEAALNSIKDALSARGLTFDGTLQELNLDVEQVVILTDGNY